MNSISEKAKFLSSSEYDFLRTNSLLKDNICMLALGGSKAYGTNVPSSDTDVRGISINPFNQIYGFRRDFEQVVDTDTDTVIYSLNKMIGLLTKCNPNTIEILGCRSEDYLYLDENGQDILDIKKSFLSVIAIDSFGGYANSQYNRMNHALLGNGENDDKTLQMLRHSLNCAIDSFNSRHKINELNLDLRILDDDEYLERMKYRKQFIESELKKKLDESLAMAEGNESRIQSAMALYMNAIRNNNEDFDKRINDMVNDIDNRIVVSGSFSDYPIGYFQSIIKDINKIKSEYGQLNKRNTKKTDAKMSKHMMQLLRLFFMGIDINERLEIRTYREDPNEHKILMDTRNKKYLYANGTKIRSEYYDVLNEVQKRFKYSMKHTILPEKPDYDTINAVVDKIYTRKYREDIHDCK
jgi:predicted nucleotidyltransferase